MDFSALTPAKGTGIVRKSSRSAGVNPFLAEDSALQTSYQTGDDYYLDMPGAWEQTVYKRGAQKGEPTIGLTGDAAEVSRLLRDAANKLGIGVSIQYEPNAEGEGKAPKRGHIRVKFVAKERKQKREVSDTEE